VGVARAAAALARWGLTRARRRQITDDGESSWLFESKPRFTPHPTEARIFWWSLYLFTAAWVLLAFVALLKLNFASLVKGRLKKGVGGGHPAPPAPLSLTRAAPQMQLMVVVALALNGANVVGYTKCDKDAKQRLTGLAADYSRSFLMSVLTSAVSAALPAAAAAAPAV
jgi:hypothetical protein